MKNEHATAVIDAYLETDVHPVPHAILVEGPWGSGKTYFLEKIYEPDRQAKAKVERFYKTPFLFVSLFGVKTAADVEKRMHRAASPGEVAVGKTVGTLISGGLEFLKIKDATNTLIAVGMLWLASFGVGASPWQIAFPMALIGIGNGAAMAPLTASGVHGVEARDQGAASGLVNVAHQLGGSLGLSLLVVVFAAGAAPDLAPSLEEAAQIGHQISATLIGGAAMNVAAFALAAAFIWPAERRQVPLRPEAATALATTE